MGSGYEVVKARWSSASRRRAVHRVGVDAQPAGEQDANRSSGQETDPLQGHLATSIRAPDICSDGDSRSSARCGYRLRVLRRSFGVYECATALNISG